MKIIQAKDLTDEQKEQFTAEFYDYMRYDTPDDQQSPLPWGCPWMFGFVVSLRGDSIEDMIDNYINDYNEEWE